MKKILIVEDEIVVAKDMEYMLAAKDFDVVGVATSFELAKRALQTSSPDLILCDINLSGGKSGLDLMEEVQTRHSIPFIFITAYSDMETIERANRLRPVSYITKPFNEKQLISSIRLALINEPKPDAPSQREQNVLKLIARGMSSTQIAEALSISFNTVETHRKKMMRKYNVHTTAELICLATSKGWVEYKEGI